MSSGRIDVRSPYDGAFAGSTPLAGEADIDAAVAAARSALDRGEWADSPPSERIAVLRKFAELHAARAEEFAQLVTAENGIPIWATRAVQAYIVPQNQAYLSAAEEFGWETRGPARFGSEGADTVWRREPVGVVAAIIPWNAPHQSALTKLFPALLAGCSVILKLAPETALDGQLLADLFVEAGLPTGVLSIIVAEREQSEYLVTHPGVDKIAFTGSTAAGRRIAALAGERLKRFSLELGGKSAAVVLEGANLDAVIANLKFGSFFNNGQACVGLTRVVVPRGVQDRVAEGLAALVSGMPIGNPVLPDTFIGPLVAERQRQRVESFIQAGIDEGARLVIGGTGRPDGIDFGAFVKPTVFANVDPKARIAQEEIFGPVVSIIPYDGLEEAIRISNDSDYGLNGAVWAADREQGLEVARRLKTGGVSVNGRGRDFSAPFGGYKQSGIGREYGSSGLNSYVELKAVML
ncbi:MAG: aldehyde dehydrogenase [Candidatus Sphingomonas phytovorans]|nr:aldehyde dehydrogenase [Sphingomonas sp.]WEK02250.1 MAG: aldehyde dehydrogenase [Sphingomonas sp.]